jgi:hypothetical protein
VNPPHRKGRHFEECETSCLQPFTPRPGRATTVCAMRVLCCPGEAGSWLYPIPWRLGYLACVEVEGLCLGDNHGRGRDNDLGGADVLELVGSV